MKIIARSGTGSICRYDVDACHGGKYDVFVLYLCSIQRVL